MKFYGIYIVLIGHLVLLVNIGTAHFQPIHHQTNQAIFILDGTQNIRSPKYTAMPRDGTEYEDYPDYGQRSEEIKEFQDEDEDEEPEDYMDPSETRFFGLKRHKRRHRRRHRRNPFHKFTKRLRHRVRHLLPGRVLKKVLKALIIPGSLAGILTGTLVSAIVGVGVGTVAGGLAGAGAGALGGIVVPGRDITKSTRNMQHMLADSADNFENNEDLTKERVFYELTKEDLRDLQMAVSRDNKKQKIKKRRKFERKYIDYDYDS